MTMSEKSKIPVPKWLDELQQRSWEPEILLSGIVLYGMFKVPGILDDFLAFYKLNIYGNSNDVDNLVSLFKTGIYWLITGLILHLICRGIWIGIVGLSYTFPAGIRMEKLNYKEPFKPKVEKIVSYEQIIIRLEKISSALFSISFMLFMSLIGGYLYFLVMLVAPFMFFLLVLDMGFSGPLFDGFQKWVFVVLTVGILGLVDFLSLGYFRRFKIIAKILWPLHRFISTLTLSRFYRPIYYGMVTNFNKWAFFAFLLIFTVISIFGAGNNNETYPGDLYSRISNFSSAQNYSTFLGNYDDQNDEIPSVRAHIPSDIITGNVLRLFVVAQIRYEDTMEEITPIDSLKKAYPDTSNVALKNMVVANFFNVKIDDQEITNLRWYFHYKGRLGQRGYLTYIDISDLKEGLHTIDVLGPESKYSNPISVIPFYKDELVDRTVDQNRALDTKESDPDFQPKPFGIRE